MPERINKVNSLIQQELSQIMARELEFPNNALVTITRVKTSPDLKYAKIYISVLPDNMRGSIMSILQKSQAFLRQELGKKMTTRITPKLNFNFDENEIYASEIDKMLDEL